MTVPVDIDVFNSYKTALARTLVPSLNASVRGIEVRLNVVKRDVQVVLHALPSAQQALDGDLANVAHSVSLVTHDIGAFAAYTSHVAVTTCRADSPLHYRGCPVWGRTDAQWELAPDLAATLASRRS